MPRPVSTTSAARRDVARLRIALLAGLLLIGAAIAQSAHAGGYGYYKGPRVGITIGGGWGPGWHRPGWGPGWGHGWGYRPPVTYWGGYWGPPRVWVAPPPIVYGAPALFAAPAYVPPTQYVERGDQPLPAGFWYYCHGPQGYFPQVPDCPGGWTQVAPQPAAPPAPPAGAPPAPPGGALDPAQQR